MALKSFCGLLTLQVGATVLSAVFLTLACVILIVNIFDYKEIPREVTPPGVKTKQNQTKGAEDTQYEGYLSMPIALVLILVGGFALAGILAFASSYNDSRTSALGALLVVIVMLIYWLVLSVLSFMSNAEILQDICIYSRCPETFWLAPLNYRTQSKDLEGSKSQFRWRRSAYNVGLLNFYAPTTKIPLYLNLLEREYDTDINSKHSQFGFTQSHRALRMVNISTTDKMYNYSVQPNTTVFAKLKLSQTSTTPTQSWVRSAAKSPTDTKKEDGTLQRNFGAPLIAAITLFIINFIFMIYSALSLWSWAQDLDWADYYVEDYRYYY